MDKKGKIILLGSAGLLILSQTDLFQQTILGKSKQDIASFVFQNYGDIASRYSNGGHVDYIYTTPLDILAIIAQESGFNLLKGLKNYQIVGDLGASFGVMQIQNPALQDVNNYFHRSTTLKDIKENAEMNIYSGSGYYELCFRKALAENSSDPRYLAFRKYNAGINGAKDSNTAGKAYADSVTEYRKFMHGIVFL